MHYAEKVGLDPLKAGDWYSLSLDNVLREKVTKQNKERGERREERREDRSEEKINTILGDQCSNIIL